MLIMQNRTQLSQGPHASISPWLSKCLREGCFMTTPNRKRWETLQRDEEGRRLAGIWGRQKHEIDENKKKDGECRGEEEWGFFLSFSPSSAPHLVSHSGARLSVYQSPSIQVRECGQFTNLRGMNVQWAWGSKPCFFFVLNRYYWERQVCVRECVGENWGI